MVCRLCRAFDEAPVGWERLQELPDDVARMATLAGMRTVRATGICPTCQQPLTSLPEHVECVECGELATFVGAAAWEEWCPVFQFAIARPHGEIIPLRRPPRLADDDSYIIHPGLCPMCSDHRKVWWFWIPDFMQVLDETRAAALAEVNDRRSCA